MISISIEVKSERMKELLSKFPAESAKIVQTEVYRWALMTANAAKKKAPYRTGNLAQSIMGYRSGNGASVVASVNYAKYVEPPPLGVPMTRKMTRTQFLYNSAMAEADKMVDRIAEKINKLFGG